MFIHTDIATDFICWVLLQIHYYWLLWKWGSVLLGDKTTWIYETFANFVYLSTMLFYSRFSHEPYFHKAEASISKISETWFIDHRLLHGLRQL